MISEFLAANGSRAPLVVGDLLDADGDSSDWIELHNPTAGPFDLGGWYLTDDANEPAKWRFPSPTVLAPDGFLVVFASGKNRTTGQLHTSFKLSADGGYLALVLPDGRTVAHEYAPSYPPQLTDVSYGLAEDRVSFVTSQSTASYHVPSAEDEGRNWTAVAFDDSSWRTAPASLTFSSSVAGQTIRTKDDLRDQMLGKNASVWIRVEFEADPTESVDSLLLYMQYEDGFVAYLNGVEVARDNFTGVPRWDSAAGSDRADGRMSQSVTFDISAHKGLLLPGHNVLAIQGLNDNRANPMFLIAPALVASGAANVPQYLAMPTPGRPNLSGSVEVVAGPRFSHEHGLYDAPLYADAVLRHARGGHPLHDGRQAADRSQRADVRRPHHDSNDHLHSCDGVQARPQVEQGGHAHLHLPDQVAQQPAKPPGFPTPVGLDRRPITRWTRMWSTTCVRTQMTQALKSLPTMSDRDERGRPVRGAGDLREPHGPGSPMGATGVGRMDSSRTARRAFASMPACRSTEMRFADST